MASEPWRSPLPPLPDESGRPVPISPAVGEAAAAALHFEGMAVDNEEEEEEEEVRAALDGFRLISAGVCLSVYLSNSIDHRYICTHM